MTEKRFDVTALGEILIDFTEWGFSDAGTRLFAQNPGGAVANVAAAVARLGGRAAFVGKVGADMHGAFLRQTLQAVRSAWTGSPKLQSPPPSPSAHTPRTLQCLRLRP